MKIFAYVLHDITSETHTYPFFASNNQVAKRITQNMVKQPGSIIYDNPEDFRLYCIGTYDDATALFEHCEKQFICRANELIIPQSLEEN